MTRMLKVERWERGEANFGGEGGGTGYEVLFNFLQEEGHSVGKPFPGVQALSIAAGCFWLVREKQKRHRDQRYPEA